ncbi:hypothetical protein BT63DRAFT_380516, partial [Microthyrium microscopicum]
GNASEGGDVGGSPGKSSLFFLTVYHPGIEQRTSALSGALPTILENPPEELGFTPGRTHNRSRSPRIGSKGRVRWALGGTLGSRSALALGQGLSSIWDVCPWQVFWPSGVRLTTNLELVRTRGI